MRLYRASDIPGKHLVQRIGRQPQLEITGKRPVCWNSVGGGVEGYEVREAGVVLNHTGTCRPLKGLRVYPEGTGKPVQLAAEESELTSVPEGSL